MYRTEFRHGVSRAQASPPATAGCSPLLSVLAVRIQTLLDRLEGIEERLQTLDTPAEVVADATSGARRRIIVGDLVIDHDSRRVCLGESEVELSPTEYRLLYELARNAGRVVLYRDLMRRTRGGYAPDSRYLKVYIGRLRSKLSQAGRPESIVETVRGVGYRMAVPRD
ncbi:MAG: winged helix-turn-helix domain-containing protein [Dehalococcoidia bacterium]